MSLGFAGQDKRIFSIPAGADFLGDLAEALAKEFDLANNPEALADALIYVPNRRSERALAFAIHRAAGGRACLLPMIRALGDLETSDPPPSAEAALADLPPVISPAERLGRLTRLVMAYFEATSAGLPAVSCLSAARELARLLDQAALSGEVAWDQLDTLVPNAELATHWQKSLEFLKIITDQWPVELQTLRAMDPYARRLAAAEAMVAEWQKSPPQAPVIIAGSTGATPASRLLMKTALELPNGYVVLPGLDLELKDETLQQILQTPSHPQFALASTLTALQLETRDVATWSSPTPSTETSARRRLIHQALAPAQSTADWTSNLAQIAPDGDAASFVREALNGLTVIEASDESEEALLAAILMRETLETDGETAALVTPDAGLARRVSAMLTWWDVHVPPSAGRPLPQTDAGSLALLVAEWLVDLSNPVALMAVLNHPRSRFDSAAIGALDIALRGPRVWQSWAELTDHLSENEILQTLTPTASELEPLAERPLDGETWLQAIAELAQAASLNPYPWAGEDGASLSRLFQDLAVLTTPLGAQPAATWNELLGAEAQLQTVSDGQPHPRLAIWGPLEARLQTADRIILAGLNEGVWPEQPPADAFLPRIFRRQIGLSDPDERVGLSAHDFAQLASAPYVTLLASHRRDDKPAIASRWLWRLQTLARGALGDDAKAVLGPPVLANPLDWLEAIETAPDLPPGFSAEPVPRPPLSARPKELSVTRIEQLVRDPYAIYCEYVLRLRPLDPLNLPADVRARGTAVHKALERFELEDFPEQADALLGVLEEELRRGGVADADIISLRDVRRQVCAEYIDWRSEQAHAIQGRPYTELRGEIEIAIAGEPFKLKGTADRIEARETGGVAILDFKTGRPPSEKQVRAGLSPQMPLQGLIARNGGYKELGKAEVEALTYIRFGTGFDVQNIGDAAARGKIEAKSMAEVIADAELGLLRVLTSFADPAHPYLSAPRPERVIYESAYTRLARRSEWTGLSTYD
ncbi:MAG: double-strand break repair protein AddB [Henriciella sp.]